MKRLQRMLSCLLLWGLLAGMTALPASALSDVPEDFWAREDIDRCISLRYFYPESDGSFGVGKEMTRAEFVVVLCRTLGWKPTSPARAVYEDISEKEWYAGAIETAYHRGAITSQDGSFRPGDPVTRSEAAAMLVRALGYGSIAGLIQDMSLPFRDVKANNGYIVMAYGLGLMDGTSVTAFSPGDHVTREQAAAILMRLHDKLHNPTTSRIGIAVSSADLPELTGYEAVGVAAARLTYNGAPQTASAMDPEEARAVRTAASAAGAKALLYVTGGAYHVREGEGEPLAAVLLQAVEEGDYDGLYLDKTSILTSRASPPSPSGTSSRRRPGFSGKSWERGRCTSGWRPPPGRAPSSAMTTPPWERPRTGWFSGSTIRRKPPPGRPWPLWSPWSRFTTP